MKRRTQAQISYGVALLRHIEILVQTQSMGQRSWIEASKGRLESKFERLPERIQRAALTIRRLER